MVKIHDIILVLTPQLTELFSCGIVSMHDQALCACLSVCVVCVCAHPHVSRVSQGIIATVLQPEGCTRI